jgi:hypothetical protein
MSTVRNPPAFAADSCSGCGHGGAPSTVLWQFAEQGACHLTSTVDMDVGANGFNYANYCLQL